MAALAGAPLPAPGAGARPLPARPTGGGAGGPAAKSPIPPPIAHGRRSATADRDIDGRAGGGYVEGERAGRGGEIARDPGELPVDRGQRLRRGKRDTRDDRAMSEHRLVPIHYQHFDLDPAESD